MAPGIADKKNNVLPFYGNEKTMNLNNLILTNILASHYFKVNLYQLKTYHEVVDEIYYQVTHLEPWEKGSRKTSGTTGMCGGVRGVGAGGIVSTAFCILYKLFTLKLTRKQLVGLINHTDSPYIRALGFMYIRYCQPPNHLWDWYEPYLEDEEKIDVKAGGGQIMTIGEMLRHYLVKLEWFSTLFPRIPVPIQKDLEFKLASWRGKMHSVSEVANTDSVDDASLYDHVAKEVASARSTAEIKENKSRNERDSHTPERSDYSNERRKHDRGGDRHGSAQSSRHHHSHERHRIHRSRSRSPYDSKHRTKHKNPHKSDHHRHRDHSSHRQDSDPERDAHYEKYHKEKRHGHDRKERSSHSYDKRQNHSCSHSKHAF